MIEDGPLSNTAQPWWPLRKLSTVAGSAHAFAFRDGELTGLSATRWRRWLQLASSGDGNLASVLFAYGLEDSVTRVTSHKPVSMSAGELSG